MLIRPVRSTDLESLMALAKMAGHGLTSLPVDEQRLRDRIYWAEKTFSGDVKVADADYFFVLEDEFEEVVGITAIMGAVGLKEPWYNYRLGSTLSSAPGLDNNHLMPALHVSNDLTGLSELCSLFLRADRRKGVMGRLLSKSRFLFVAEFQELFSKTLIAEMRGVSDEQGISPFWQSLGQFVYKMDFTQADHLCGIGQKEFLAQLMPAFPIYTHLLSDTAQQTIGKAHVKTVPAMKLLEEEGMSYQQYVDIFDAGPVVLGEVRNMRAVRDSAIVSLHTTVLDDDAEWFLLHNRSCKDCRITAALAKLVGETLWVDKATIEKLNLNEGDAARAVALFIPVLK
ncbi:UNVERIFIED_CONTAM: hypothetical protein GTU68_040919 [Idotea baltica]|nr:hypothetical protein [Idotea baltica]